MTGRASATPAMAGSLVGLSALCLLLAGWPSGAAADPRTNYMLDCMGCHLRAGEGVPGKVPDMRASLVPLAATPAGRRYLVGVPGAAQAPISNRQLARLLNWMIRNLSATPVPKETRPFTAEEVAAYRKTPLVNVASIREDLLGNAARRASDSP